MRWVRAREVGRGIEGIRRVGGLLVIVVVCVVLEMAVSIQHVGLEVVCDRRLQRGGMDLEAAQNYFLSWSVLCMSMSRVNRDLTS